MPLFSMKARISASARAYAAPLPRMMSGRLAPFSTSSARCTASGAGSWRGAGSTTLHQRAPAGRRVDRLREQLGREVEVHAAGPARDRRADGAGDADADVFGVEHAIGGLAQGLGDRELVHLLVVALLQVDDLALARAADEDHREAVGRRVGERGQAVEEARRRHRQADAGLAGEKARRGGGVAGMLLVAERDDAKALGLHLSRQVGDRNAGQPEHGVDAVQLQRLDDELEAVDRLFGVHAALAARRVFIRRGGARLEDCGHACLLGMERRAPGKGSRYHRTDQCAAQPACGPLTSVNFPGLASRERPFACCALPY